jgi:hypothetical protein
MGRARHRQSERGASIVEFALVAPIFFLLVMGICEFGVGFSNNIALRQGVREGARQGAVANVGSNTSCPVTGTTPNTDTKKLICLTKDRIGLDETKTRVKVVLTGPYQRGTSVIVCAQHKLNSVTGMFAPVLDDRELTTKVEMRIEETAGTLAAAQETPPAGGDWSWCA